MERLDYKWKFNEVIKKKSPGTTTIDDALAQWRVILKEKGKDDCICTRPNITRLNIVENTITQEIIIVGECCVQKFNIKDLDIKCCECSKPLTIDNKYVKALYKNGVVLNEKSKVIGHNKCNKISSTLGYLEARASFEPPTGSINKITYSKLKYLVKYFDGIIKYAGINSSCELELEYEEKYKDYLELLYIIHVDKLDRFFSLMAIKKKIIST